MTKDASLRPDILVIGTDPAGIELAFAAAALGAPVMLVRDPWPSNPETERALARLAALGVRIITGPGQFLDPKHFKAGDQVIRARRYVLAGAAPAQPPDIAGLADLPAPAPKKGRAALVIGAGADAIERALDAHAKGAAVTLVSEGPLLEGFDSDSTRLMRSALAHSGIVLHENCALPDAAIIPAPSGKHAFKLATAALGTGFAFDDLLVSPVAKPLPTGLGLAQAGIRHAEGRLVLSAGLATTNRRVVAIGTLSNDPFPARNRAAQVGAALGALLFRRASATYPRLAIRATGALEEPLPPGLLGIAETGLREDDLDRAARARHNFHRARLDDIGQVKVITDAKDRIVGVSVAGRQPLAMLDIFRFAMDKGVPLADLAATQDGAVGEVARRALRRQLMTPGTLRLMRLLRHFG